jgi:methylamine methyltransferase corrinoid protein reductive activase
LELVVGLDIGTSGLRLQALDAETKKIISTAISLHNPLPGSNVIDHLHFAVKAGSEAAHGIITDTINSLLKSLEVDLKAVKRMALCGNPTQMSIFQGIECRDLVFGGDNMLKRLGVKRLERRATVMNAGSLGLAINSEAEVYIPPTVEQQIGADALAMIIKSGILDQKKTCMVTDYGTNAEIGLKVGDAIYTGSCAAGPAIEGGEIEKGVLASPGAISDVSDLGSGGWNVQVLNNDLISQDSFSVNPQTGEVQEKFPTHFEPRGITGTGTIATMAVGFDSGLLQRLPPYITTPDGCIHLTKDQNIVFTKKDYLNSTRCFGAFKAGHITLVGKSGVAFEDIKSMYLCGASGTYVDAVKAQKMSLALPTVSDIYQVGNTSLAMANDCAVDPEWLDRMQEMANAMKPTYFAFIKDEVFKKAYIIEMDHWEHGLTPERRIVVEKRFKVPHYPEQRTEAKVHKVVLRDIADFGSKGLHIMEHAGIVLNAIFEECTGCRQCEKNCMPKALKVEEKDGQYIIKVSSEGCTGHACMKCELTCPARVFRFENLEFAPGKKAW